MKIWISTALLLALSPTLVAQDTDLVFVSVTPCVVFDTRPQFGGTGAFAPQEVRSFHIAGAAADFPAQGGTSGGCGVPGWSGGTPVALAVFINYVAIAPQGSGQIKAWAFDRTEPAEGALVNYQTLSPRLDNSNGAVTELRRDSEGPDITVRARSSGTHMRGVVLGYFTADHITGIDASTGLAGGGPSGSVTIGISDGGVGAAQLSASGSISGQQLTASGASVEWQNPAAPTGSTGATGATGRTGPTGPTSAGPGALPFTLSALDTTGDVGTHTSITIGADGLALIAYHDVTNGDLKVAHCSNVSCSSATTSTIDGTDTVGLYNSITIGADGLGLISYHSETAGTMKVAHCNDITCSSATVNTVVNSSSVDEGEYTSIVIGSDGLGLISYHNTASGDLQVAHCNNVVCSSVTTAFIDTGASTIGRFSSITIGGDGLGLISYLALPGYDLRVAHCNNVVCSSATLSTVDDFLEVGDYTSITVGSDGLGLISYYHAAAQDLKVAHCTNSLCSTSSSVHLDTVGVAGTSTSITMGRDGRGLISYSDFGNGNLKVAHCSNVPCNSAVTSTIASAGVVGSHTSITIGTDGLGLISYYDATNGDLMVAHLSGELGIPFTRRR
jgi:hypothetical protein